MKAAGQVNIPTRKAPQCVPSTRSPNTKVCTGTVTTLITDINRANATQLRKITLTFNLKNRVRKQKSALFLVRELKSIRFDYTRIGKKSNMSIVVTGNLAVRGFMMSMYKYLLKAMGKNSPYSFPKCLAQLQSPFQPVVRAYIHQISGVNNIPPILHVHVDSKGVLIKTKP